MFVIDVTKNQAKMKTSEPMTSGSQNVYVVQFNFSEEWEVLEKTAVFATEVGSNGPVTEDVYNQLLGEDARCFIPWEVNKYVGRHVYVGVFGTMDGEVVLPTIWVDVGSVLLGVTTGLELEPPTPTLWEQILSELYLIRRDVKNIEVGSSLEVFDGVTINNVNMFNGLDLPRSVIFLDSSIISSDPVSGTVVTLPFVSDVVQLEDKIYIDENQNESPALFVTSLSGLTTAFLYNDEGFFVASYPIKNTVDPDDFLANGTFIMCNWGETPPMVGTIRTIYSSNFIGRKPSDGDSVKGLGWVTDGNIYRFEAVVRKNTDSESDDEWTAELIEAEWLKVIGADGKDGQDGKDGVDGKDGIDGENGKDGSDGFSPTVTITEIEGGHQVSITDANGTQSFDVMDGKDGLDGDSGPEGSVGEVPEFSGVDIKTLGDLYEAIGLSTSDPDTYIGFVKTKDAVAVIFDGGYYTIANSLFYLTVDLWESYQSGSTVYRGILDIYSGGRHEKYTTAYVPTKEGVFAEPFTARTEEIYASRDYVNNAVKGIKVDLPTGEATQVMGFNSETKSPEAKTLTNDMMPVIDVAHGGTGQKNAPAAMDALVSNGTSGGGSFSSILSTYTNVQFIYYNPTTNGTTVQRIDINNLRNAMVGALTPIVSASTDYTTSRARAISLHTTMPTTGLVNGCLYGIYS